MKKTLTLLTTAFCIAYCSIVTATANHDAKYKHRLFLALEGDWLFPNEVKSAFTIPFITTISSQKIKDRFGYAGVLGINFRNGLYTDIDFRRFAPKFSFDVKTVLKQTVFSVNYKYLQSWDFNTFSINFGKSADLNNSVNVNSYIGISGLDGRMEFTQLAGVNVSFDRHKLDIGGYGFKFGLRTVFDVLHNNYILGGIETAIYAVKVTGYDDKGSGYNKISETKKPVSMPFISLYVAYERRLNKNINMQLGMRSFNVFDFSTRGYVTNYALNGIESEVGGTYAFTRLSLKF